MNDWYNPKHDEINLRARNKIEELRLRQRQRLQETEEKINFQKNLFQEKTRNDEEKRDEENRRRLNLKRYELDRKAEELEKTLKYRSQEIEEKRNYERSLDEARTAGSIDLEILRYELRQAERLPNFEDYKMRAELEFLIQRETRLDINRLENVALERRITELRALNRGDVHKLVMGVVLEHIQREKDNKRTIAEIEATTKNEILRADRSTDNDLVRAEQAHQHREKEMFTERFLDAVFSQMSGQSTGLTKEDLERIADEWRKEGDKFKR